MAGGEEMNLTSLPPDMLQIIEGGGTVVLSYEDQQKLMAHLIAEMSNGVVREQPRQHCDHECVCARYQASHSDFEDEDADACTLACMQRSSLPATSTEKPRPPCEECIYQAQTAKAREEALAAERMRISGEVIRILKEHPARIVNKFFLLELAESIKSTSTKGGEQ